MAARELHWLLQLTQAHRAVVVSQLRDVADADWQREQSLLAFSLVVALPMFLLALPTAIDMAVKYSELLPVITLLLRVLADLQ